MERLIFMHTGVNTGIIHGYTPWFADGDALEAHSAIKAKQSEIIDGMKDLRFAERIATFSEDSIDPISISSGFHIPRNKVPQENQTSRAKQFFKAWSGNSN